MQLSQQNDHLRRLRQTERARPFSFDKFANSGDFGNLLVVYFNYRAVELS
jgi:hypothetical protein